ncbi:MAG: RNA methyltransferase [Chloroflexi bacterium]|nr:RNA methyltransferase [Chloroflexota bacterium]
MSQRGRQETGAFLVEGEKAIKQIAENRPNDIIEIVTVESSSRSFSDHPVRVVTEKQFNSISPAKTPQGTMAIVRMPEEINTDELPESAGSKVLLLEDIQDPGNVGTIIRTAVAFGFDGAILSDKCADPFSPKCVQSTAGTVLSLWIRRTTDHLKLADRLKMKGFSLIVADVNGTDDVRILSSNNRLVLSLCNESSGPSVQLMKLSDQVVGIPIDRSKAESLNVAICGAICMYLSTTECNDSVADPESF